MKTVSLQLEKDLSDVAQVTGDRYSVSNMFKRCCVVCCYTIVNELPVTIERLKGADVTVLMLPIHSNGNDSCDRKDTITKRVIIERDID